MTHITDVLEDVARAGSSPGSAHDTNTSRTCLQPSFRPICRVMPKIPRAEHVYEHGTAVQHVSE